MNVEKQGHLDVVYHGMFNYMQVISHNKELETYRQYCLKQKLDPDDKETVLSNFQKFCCLFPEDNDVLGEIVLTNNTGIYCKYELEDAFKYILQHQKAVDVMKIIVSQYFNSPELPKMVYWNGRHELPDASELANLPGLRFMELDRTSSWDIYKREKY
ncbi:MAG: hypothetical protein IJ599_04610 [Alphaproteobacteria bacterium]|nr:hypothetical protein [Alphaproteobacteria bacterium]